MTGRGWRRPRSRPPLRFGTAATLALMAAISITITAVAIALMLLGAELHR